MGGSTYGAAPPPGCAEWIRSRPRRSGTSADDVSEGSRKDAARRADPSRSGRSGRPGQGCRGATTGPFDLAAAGGSKTLRFVAFDPAGNASLAKPAGRRGAPGGAGRGTGAAVPR